jgi:hypothetical protein
MTNRFSVPLSAQDEVLAMQFSRLAGQKVRVANLLEPLADFSSGMAISYRKTESKIFFQFF